MDEQHPEDELTKRIETGPGEEWFDPSITPDDAAGEELRDLIGATSRLVDRHVTSARRPTICKTRYMAGHQQLLRVDQISEPEALRDYFKTNYGPTIAAYRGIADDADRTAELDQALVDLAVRSRTPDGSLDWEYLLVTATVA